MPLQKLTAQDLAKLDQKQKPTAGREKSPNPYTAFFKSIRVGQGGKAVVAEEGVGRQFLKLKISRAAKEAGITIAYRRSGPDEVVFKVVGRS